MQERQCVQVQAFPVLSQATTTVEPANGPLDDPAPGQHHKLASVGPLDDLDIDLAANALQSLLEFRPLVAAVGVEFEQKRVQTEQCAHQQHTAVAVLDVGGMYDGL